MATSYFRGLKSIEEVKARLIDLAEFYKRFRPDVTRLILARTDYDLIKRWPNAAHVAGFVVTENGIFYRGLELHYDASVQRYGQKQTPIQAVIE